MTLALQEGQTFPADYILDRRLAATESHESWVATQKQTGDRVLVRVLTPETASQFWSDIERELDAIRGLVHENVVLATKRGTEDNLHYLVEPFVAGAVNLNLGASHGWQELRQFVEAMDFVHHLGITHGHLHPGNILVAADGTLKVTGWGLPATLTGSESQDLYLSPQVVAGSVADKSDDIYSLGCFIFTAATSRQWTGVSLDSVELDAPLPPDLYSLLDNMLSDSPPDRAVTLAEVRDSLDRFFTDKPIGIESFSYSRAPEPAAAGAESTPATVNAGRNRQAVSANLVFAGAGALLVLAALLFLLLPSGSPDRTAATELTVAPAAEAPGTAPSGPASTEPGPRVTPLEAAQLKVMEEQGAELATEILRTQLELEDLGINLWAADDYAALSDQLDQADASYREGLFQDALAGYEAVLDQLIQLRAGVPDVLNTAVTNGDRALEGGDSQGALEAFTIARAINPADAVIRKKLQRAENLEEVMSLVRQAEVQERNGDIEESLARFRQAAALDPAWPAATDGVNRLAAAIRDRDFQVAMSRGFQGIADRDYDAARKGFNAAASIKPASPEPEDGLAQVAQAETNDAILLLREQAESFIADNEWQSAIDTYNEALAITNTLEFAQQGIELAASRLDLDRRLEGFLQDPTILQSDEQLRLASETIREASRISPPTPQITRQIDTLARLISTARVELPLTIRSDGKTEVTVRRHRALGKITQEVIYLIPGKYTLVGVRPGYRDVREEVVILAGSPLPDVKIASTERVR